MKLTPQQLHVLTETALGEAADQGEKGQAAVVWTILNRANSGKWGTSDPAAVALQNKQFSAWNKGVGGNRLVRTSPNSASYKAAQKVVQDVVDGAVADPTGGATYYVNPKGTKWRPPGSQTAKIGGHVFYNDGGPIPPMNVGETAQGRQMPLGMGRGQIKTGPQVRQLQQQLADAGFNPGKVDGVFGPNTAAAVRAAETKYGLTPDKGVAGPQVLGALESASHPAYAPGGGVMPPPAYSPGGAVMPPQTTPNPAAFQQPQRPITPAPAGRGDLAARPYDSGNLYPGITQNDLITGPPDPYTQAAINGGPPGAAALTGGPAPSAGLAQPYGATIGGNPSGPLGMNQDLLGAVVQGSDFPAPSSPPMGVSAGLVQPYGAMSGGSPFGPAGMDQGLLGAMQPAAPQPPTTAPVSINDVAATAAGIPKALGLGDWFGAGKAAAEPTDIFKSVPPAVPSPYGVPSDTVPYSPPPQQQSYYTPPSGRLTNMPQTADASGSWDAVIGPMNSHFGWGLDSPVAGGASAAGAAEPSVVPAGGPPAVSAVPSMYNVPPDPGTGGSAAMIQPYAGFTPVYTPPPAVRTDPVQQKSMLRSASGETHGGDYKSLGGGNGPGGYNVASNSYAPWSGAAPYQGYMGGGFATPSGNYSNSPWTPSSQGWQAPNFSPGSGGSTYATMPNGYGGGTYVDSHGNRHSY